MILKGCILQLLHGVIEEMRKEVASYAARGQQAAAGMATTRANLVVYPTETSKDIRLRSELGYQMSRMSK